MTPELPLAVAVPTEAVAETPEGKAVAGTIEDAGPSMASAMSIPGSSLLNAASEVAHVPGKASRHGAVMSPVSDLSFGIDDAGCCSGSQPHHGKAGIRIDDRHTRFKWALLGPSDVR